MNWLDKDITWLTLKHLILNTRRTKPLVIGSTIQRRARQTDLLMSQQPQILRTNKDLTIIIKQGLLRMDIILFF